MSRGGNPVVWIPQGLVAGGVFGNGLSVRFAIWSGNMRADYLDIVHDTSAVRMFANMCTLRQPPPPAPGGPVDGGTSLNPLSSCKALQGKQKHTASHTLSCHYVLLIWCLI